ncbi:MAG: Asp-tRNA(Asn)/Glu-tRNA(Gln) amidotransferase subunit GatC [Candidatus Latescibacterota bacterium]|nr:MAG: Asp-tRNA(Asn)/Glu-tRNA(Gln) amidotransferase subunit GatC [Candidatus Latescibacterota bacterium]
MEREQIIETMPVDKKMITHLEALARIELTPQEKERLALQLDRIITYVKQLEQIDTTGVEPTSLVIHENHSGLRPDRPGDCIERDTILGDAPDIKRHLFRVPKIIER